jgi:hypothetical protein
VITSVVLSMSLVTGLANPGEPEGPAAPPAAAEGTEAAPGQSEAAAPKNRFVFAFLPALTFGLGPAPSFDLPLFFGRRLKRSPWALGFQLTMSIGGAERYFLGIFTHRYHVTAMTSFGKNDRGFASVGGGLAVRLWSPLVEAEGRLGFRFGARRRGMVGGVVRLGYDFMHRELAPAPQVGVVLGVQTF